MTASNPPSVDTWDALTDSEARVVEAMTARIFPSEDDSPGAREAQVVRFIDRALANTAVDLVSVYRTGVRLIDSVARGRVGDGFAELNEHAQDDILLSIDARGLDDQLTIGEQDKLRDFFATVREHTIQGMFCDPEYGGNAECVGWNLIGFPGAQWGYSAEQMRPGFDSTTVPVVTLADLRQRLGDKSDGHNSHLKERS